MKEFSETDIVKNFSHKDKSKIIKFIELVYGQKSKLTKIQDIQERKETAAVKAGLNLKSEDAKNILSMKDEKVNDLIFYFQGIFQNSNKLHKLCSDQQLFWSMQRRLQKPIDETLDDLEAEKLMISRSKISAESDVLMSRIDRLYSEIFGSDDEVEVAEGQVRKILSPEQRLKG